YTFITYKLQNTYTLAPGTYSLSVSLSGTIIVNDKLDGNLALSSITLYDHLGLNTIDLYYAFLEPNAIDIEWGTFAASANTGTTTATNTSTTSTSTTTTPGFFIVSTLFGLTVVAALVAYRSRHSIFRKK
ncbi:MAG: hypothetical protein ACFFBD_29465, partial [Candidatus Hodarchaeota archaeon]